MKWKSERRIANSLLIFLIFPTSDNLSGETLPSSCIGILPSDGSYTACDIENWMNTIFSKCQKFDLSIDGVASDNYPCHQKKWMEWFCSQSSSFLPTSYASIGYVDFVPFSDSPHLLRNWLYSIQNAGRLMIIGNLPVLYEDLIEMNKYYPFNSSYLDPKKKMNQDAAEFFFSPTFIENLIAYFPRSSGTSIYLVYGCKIWSMFMNREISTNERLSLASEVLCFLIIWWNHCKTNPDLKVETNCLPRNTLKASVLSCLSLFALNQKLLENSSSSFPCTWRLTSSP